MPRFMDFHEDLKRSRPQSECHGAACPVRCRWVMTRLSPCTSVCAIAQAFLPGLGHADPLGPPRGGRS